MKKNLVKYFSLFCIAGYINACTYNVSMAHTEGVAEDVIDDTQSNTPNVSPNLSVSNKPM